METLSPPRSHRKPLSHHSISAPPNQPAGHLANPTNYHLRRKEKYVIIFHSELYFYFQKEDTILC